MPEPLAKERRKSPRKYLEQPLPIEDRNCGTEIGRVVEKFKTYGVRSESQVA